MNKNKLKDILVRMREKYCKTLKGLSKYDITPGLERFSFCETQYNTGGSIPWHVRKLTDEGPKFGGGADTKSLCGREVAWDLEVEMTELNLLAACPACMVIWEGLSGDSDVA